MWIGWFLETGNATSLIYIPFLFGTPFDVFTKYEMGVLTVDRASPVIDNFLVLGLGGQELGELLSSIIIPVVALPALELNSDSFTIGSRSDN